MTLHERITEAYANYMKEQDAVNKKVKAASTRARKALMELIKLSKERRKEISDNLKEEK